MKIIIATHLYPPEIAEPAPYVEKISQALERKHKIIVVTYANVQNNTSPVELLTVKKNQPLFWRLVKYTITLFRAAKNADLIYAQNGSAVSLPAVIVKYLRRRPLVIRFYQDEAWQRAQQTQINKQTWENFLAKPTSNPKIKFILAWQKFVFKIANKIIAPSQFSASILKKFYQTPKEKIAVNYNPAPKQEILPFPNQKQKGQITAFSLNNFNHLANIIQALKNLAEKFRDLHLIIIGPVENRKKLKNLAGKLKISFLERASQAEKQYFVQTSQIQIIAPNHSLEPDIALVGLINGVITIGLEGKGLDEIIVNWTSGILLKTSQAKEIKKAVEQIIFDHQLEKKLSQETKKIAEQKFCLAKHIKVLEKIFKNL